MPPVSPLLWRHVAEALAADGFDIFVSLGPNEALDGVQAEMLHLPFADLLDFAHQCDLIVGLRSGALDILSGSPARMVEVYFGPSYAALFLHIWELAWQRPGLETRAVRLVEDAEPQRRMAERIVAACLDANWRSEEDLDGLVRAAFELAAP